MIAQVVEYLRTDAGFVEALAIADPKRDIAPFLTKELLEWLPQNQDQHSIVVVSDQVRTYPASTASGIVDKVNYELDIFVYSNNTAILQKAPLAIAEVLQSKVLAGQRICVYAPMDAEQSFDANLDVFKEEIKIFFTIN